MSDTPTSPPTSDFASIIDHLASVVMEPVLETFRHENWPLDIRAIILREISFKIINLSVQADQMHQKLKSESEWPHG